MEGESNREVRINRALELLMDGYYDEAVVHLERLVKQEPENYELWYYLGNAYFAKRLYSKAVRAYKKVIVLNPDFQDVYLSLADTFVKMSKLKRAVRIIKDGLRRFEGENYIYLSSIILVNGGEYKFAEKLINTLLDRGEKDSYLVVLGNIYFGMGEREKALELYDRAIELNPKNVEAWNNRGYLMFTMDNYEEAFRCYEKALEIDPNYKEAWYNRGYTHHATGQLHLAVADYWRALKIDPNDEIAWNNMGNALYNLGRYMESIPYFMKSVSINPRYEIAWNNIGNALNRMGMHRESIPFHEKALSINNKFDYAWHAKGHALCELGRYEDALEFLETALELNPDYGETWYWRGVALYKLERFEEAIESLKMAVEKEPILIEALELAGDIYSSLGYEVQALKCYEMALQRSMGEKRMDLLIKLGKYEEALADGDELTRAQLLYKLGRYEDILDLKDGKEIAYYKCLALEAMGKFEDAYRAIRGFTGDKFERERKFIKFVIEDGEFDMDVNDVEYQLRIGNTLLNVGEYEKAIRIFTSIKNRDGYYFLGEAYLALGRIKEAKRCLEIAVGLGSEMALDRLMGVNGSEEVPPEKEENKGD